MTATTLDIKTMQETKSNGPAVLSSALLDAFDAFAQSLVAHPHPMTPKMWPKGWPFFEAGWNAAILAEREACAKAMDDLAEDYKAAGLREDKRGFWPDSDKWNQRSIAFRDAAAAIRARSKT